MTLRCDQLRGWFRVYVRISRQFVKLDLGAGNISVYNGRSDLGTITLVVR